MQNLMQAFVDLGRITARGDIPDEFMDAFTDLGGMMKDHLANALPGSPESIPAGLAQAYADELVRWA